MRVQGALRTPDPVSRASTPWRTGGAPCTNYLRRGYPAGPFSGHLLPNSPKFPARSLASPSMRRTTWLSAGSALTGAALMVGGLTGTGHAAVRTSHARLATPFALIPLQPDAFTGTSVVVRWAPCIKRNGATKTHVIHYRVNPAGHASRVKLAKRAVGKLAAASGLTFAYDGKTSYLPHNALHNGTLTFQALDEERKANVPFVIAWAKAGTGPGASNLLDSGEAGKGTVSWRSGTTSELRINDGAVVIRRNAGKQLKSGFGSGGTVGSLLLHELGHAVGLQHASPGEIMAPIIDSRTPGNYAAGDRTGLAKVGRAAGCMTTPRLPAVNHF